MMENSKAKMNNKTASQNKIPKEDINDKNKKLTQRIPKVNGFLLLSSRVY